MSDVFFRENDIRVNNKISKMLVWMLVAIPLMVAGNLAGVFSINSSQLAMVAAVGVVCTCTPRYFIKKGVNHQFLKYYILIAVSEMICMLVTYPHLGIYVTLVLGAILSLLYFDPKLTLFVCVLDYILMFIAEGFRMYAMNYESLGVSGFVHSWMAYMAGYTIEFIIVCPIIYTIARQTRLHLEKEKNLINELEDSERRYMLALESTRDCIYEYDIATDVFKYFGVLLPGDKETDNPELRNEEKYIEHFISSFVVNDIIPADDILALQRFMDGDCQEAIRIRIIGKENVNWMEISGNLILENDMPCRIVGKVKDVTEQKLYEQEILNNYERDPVTGFYDRNVGIRMIREGITEPGRHDSQAFLFVSLQNTEQIVLRAGQAFLDAILLCMAEYINVELSDMDMAVRISSNDFLLYIVNRTPAMIEQLQEHLEQSFEEIYCGHDIIDRLDVVFEAYNDLAQIENSIVKFTDYAGREFNKADEYRDDIVKFAYNMLERSVDFNSSMNMLLDRIGSRYRLDSIRVYMSMSPVMDYLCSFEWVSKDAEEDNRLHKRFVFDELRSDEDIYVYEGDSLGDSEGYIIYKGSGFYGRDDSSEDIKITELSRIIADYIQKEFSKNTSQSKTDFIAAMAYEIRTPMDSVSGYAELLLQEADTNEKIKEYANNIKKSSETLLGIINDIIDVSLVENSNVKLDTSKYQFHSVIEDCYLMAGSWGDDIRFTIKADESMPDGLVGDKYRVGQILFNLLKNAKRFTAKGEIGVEFGWQPIGEGKGIINFVVWDNGVGMKQEDINKLFNIYRTYEGELDSELRAVELNLTVSKSFVTLMGGKLTVESEYGKGTRVYFNIVQDVYDRTPYTYSHDEAKPKTSKPGVPFVAPWARVLVVDDNRVNMEVAKGLLRKYEVKIVTASSGFEALDILEHDDDFDIIFMDHMMPDMDGVETTKRIRGMGNPILQKTPVIALTANTLYGMEEEFYLAGMNGYLAKPIDLKALSEIMSTYIPADKREA